MAQIKQISIKPKSSDAIGLPKSAIQQVLVHVSGVGDDHNNFRSDRLQNTLDQAVLLMTEDNLMQLRQEGWAIQPGHLGENFLISDLPYVSLKVGLQLSLGSVQVEITKACVPCKVLGNLPYVGEARVMEFIETMKGRRGWYAKVLTEGSIHQDDPVKLLQ